MYLRIENSNLKSKHSRYIGVHKRDRCEWESDWTMVET